MNELLQLLLVMDVERVGSLTYEQWTRGVLCLPEVLGCFQLASRVDAKISAREILLAVHAAHQWHGDEAAPKEPRQAQAEMFAAAV